MPKDIKFYELSKVKLDNALPNLVYKIYDQKQDPIMVILEDDNQVEQFDRLFWTFSSNRFLPHGTKKDSEAHREKITLTSELENLNKAKIIVSTKSLDQEFLKDFDIAAFMFEDSKKQEFLENFKTQPEAKYWQQDSKGKWFQAGG